MESTQADKVYINEGDHIDVEDTARLPYELLSVLGYGGSAVVEEVKDIYTQKVFARKVFRVLTRTLPQVREMFEKEIMIIRRLAPHPHIVKAFATYTTKRSLAVIIDPVADGGNLAELLAARRDCNQSDRLAYDRIIKTGFGCLAKGLAFIHSNSIRHKDIKPQNILVHQSRLLYTDFGISNDFSNSRSTTEGHPGPFTMRYCAPEVVDWGERNSKSDIFSLGCVFLEMYTDPSQDL
ncbi:kinase-like protein, partial [Polyplosphaeria fusca]